jgi:hypothetical protein
MRERERRRRRFRIVADTITLTSVSLSQMHFDACWFDGVVHQFSGTH